MFKIFIRMKFRELGKTGLKVSVIGFGGIPLQGVSNEQAEKVLKAAINQGINFFDTSHASSYGDSEKKFGLYLPREAIIATKTKERTPEKIRKDLEASLVALKREYIDVYQNHCVDSLETLKQLIENGSLDFLKQAKQEGKIKHLGISTHREDVALKALELGHWGVLQFPFNPIKREFKAVYEAQEKGIGYIAMKPLDGGNIQKTNLALKWELEHPVSTVIPGMITIEQVRENVENAEAPLLIESEREELRNSIKGLEGMCQSCHYCEPTCPQKIPIGNVLYLYNYAIKIGLLEQALGRFRKSMKGKPDPYSCIECGTCEENCHNQLPVRQMLKQAREFFKEHLGNEYDELFKNKYS